MSQRHDVASFFSLPLVGRVGERERAGVGVSKQLSASDIFEFKTPPDRRFATATLPAARFRSRGRDKEA